MVVSALRKALSVFVGCLPGRVSRKPSRSERVFFCQGVKSPSWYPREPSVQNRVNTGSNHYQKNVFKRRLKGNGWRSFVCLSSLKG